MFSASRCRLGFLQVYDRIVPNSATGTLTWLIVGIAGALAMEIALRIIRSYVIAWSAMKQGWSANVDAALRIATSPAKAIDAEPVARWLQRLQAVSTVSDFHTSQTPLVLIDLVFAVVFVTLLVLISGWAAAVPLGNPRGIRAWLSPNAAASFGSARPSGCSPKPRFAIS